MATRPHPATGAWMPGQPVGSRTFHTFAPDRPFALDAGVTLHGVTLAYETSVSYTHLTLPTSDLV